MGVLDSTEARLENLPCINQVGSAIALSAVLDRTPQAGISAWVVLLSERPLGDTRTAGPALQKVGLAIGVVLAVRTLNDQSGTKGSLALQEARDAVRGQLYGWTPEGAELPYLLGAGDLIKMAKDTIWWIDRYTTSIRRRAAQI